MHVHGCFALLLIVFLAGCGSPKDDAPPKGTESPAPPKKADDKSADTAGRITVTTGIPAKTIEEYTAAIQHDPNEVNSRGELAYQLRGTAYLTQGDNDKAIADFTEAIRLYREKKTPYYQIRVLEVLDGRAQSYCKKGETAKAISDYSEIIDFGSHFTSGGVNEVLGVQGFTTRAYMDRAQCYDELKQADKATADYRAAVKMQPSLMTDELRKRLEAKK